LPTSKTIAEPLHIAFLGMGFQPKWERKDTEWMPKGRYRIMREYMDKRGKLGQDMMSRTCTVQVNLDFSSEADMVKKFQVALALQPIATALFANSPFVDGKPCGYVSYRSHVWEDTDPDRTGMLPFVFDSSMGFERYVDYMLDVPMYFVYRNGEYLDASGQSFRDFLNGTLPILPGEKPTAQDWEDHLTTAFPEVRLKRYMEMRGADGGPWRKLCALPALWAGLLYDQSALDAAWDLVRDWSMEERLQLRVDAPRLGLNTMIRDRKLQPLALEVLELASSGLTARNRLNASGENETGFLEPLFANARAGLTPADNKLALYHGRWNESVDPVFSEEAYYTQSRRDAAPLFYFPDYDFPFLAIFGLMVITNVVGLACLEINFQVRCIPPWIATTAKLAKSRIQHGVAIEGMHACLYLEPLGRNKFLLPVNPVHHNR
jgi:glutamate--cysteine ligase